MSPSPEQVENQEPAKKRPEASATDAPRLGLALEAWVTSPTWEIGLAAILQDFTPGEVIVLLEGPITAGTQVSVQVNSGSFHGEVLYCKLIGAHWETHVSFDDVDAIGLRRTPRFPVRIPARVSMIGNDAPVESMIVDISGEGLGIEIPQLVPLSRSIVVESEYAIALGEVRHCRENSPGCFRAGVQLHHIMKKDPSLEKGGAENNWMNKLGARFGFKKNVRPRG
jgi:hypothetical protein